MRVTVLGTASVHRSDTAVDLGGPKVRALLAALALYAGRTVAPDRIIDLLWQDSPPAAAIASLQTYVARLRRALEPDRAARMPSSLLTTSTAGYCLRLPDDAIDAIRFRRLLDATHPVLVRRADTLPRIPAELDVDAVRTLRDHVKTALALWSDTPYLDLPDDDAVVAERAGLEALRLVGVEDLGLLRVALGEESSVVVDLEPWSTAHPLRESLWAIRILALARSGRQHDALAASRRIRQALADELGVDPGPMLQHLEQAVLRQSPELWWHPQGADIASTGGISPHGEGASPHDDVESAHGDGGSLHGGDESPQGGGRYADIDPAGAQLPVQHPADASSRTGASGGSDRRPTDHAVKAEWPMVGRRRQLEALAAVLDRDGRRRASVAAVIGEPGIGKSRLLRELAARASSHGFLVLRGTCSQDDGAPPLWPWAQILGALDEAIPVDPAQRIELSPGADAGRLLFAGDPAGDGGRWSLWEAVRRRLQGAATTSPLLVIIDDLHWADPSTLTLLRHLVNGIETDRIAIVVARRRFPEPTGALAAVGETLARHDAVRLELTGLEPDAIERLVLAATGQEVDAVRAGRLQERTGGNPFFLTELIRLSGSSPLEDAHSHDVFEIPSAVSDVVLARLSTLPDPSARLLSVAAVIGREFDAVLLAAVTAADIDGVLELLDPALHNGMITDVGAGQFQFSHALVREAIAESVPPTRRAGRHAQIAAALDRGQSLDPRRSRSEAVRHWLAAGPLHAEQAWRAARDEALRAMSLRAWDEAAALWRSALRAVEQVPAATDRDRYDLQLSLADACRWSGDRAGLDDALHAAIGHAERIGDAELAARAAIGTLEGTAWFPRAYSVVDTDIVQALRNALRSLPSADSELRCRVMLALATELYYAGAPQERDALVEQGLAMARRLGDPELFIWAAMAVYQATWRPSTAEHRHGLIIEALAAAVRIGDAKGEAISRFLLAGTCQETGRIDEMREQIVAARGLARQHRLIAVDVALGWLEAPWLALEGRFDAAYAMIATTSQLMLRTSMNQQSEAPAGTLIVVQMIQGAVDPQLVDQFVAIAADSNMPLSVNVLVALLRIGRVDEARAAYSTRGLVFGPESWFSLLNDCMAAEVAVELGDHQLAAEVYRRLAPFAGCPAGAAASAALWPVDAFLALAASAAGESAVATGHADDAERLCVQWRIEPAVTWIRTQRSRFGF